MPFHNTRYSTTVPEVHGTILYLHGGGLLFGNPDDLPAPYTRAFNRAGFDVIALEYPLAPGTTLVGILETLEATIGNLRAPGGMRGERVVLFGRSAGAFLAIQLMARSIQRGQPVADALLSLYGYADMSDPEFTIPSKHYLAFGIVSDTAMTTPGDDADFATRYGLYVGHRQRGTWPGTVLGAQSVDDIAIAPDILARFPPTFLAASVYDPDVPFRASKRLASAIPNAEFVRLYDTTEHDFDRDASNPIGMRVYERMLAWLERTLPR